MNKSGYGRSVLLWALCGGLAVLTLAGCGGSKGTLPEESSTVAAPGASLPGEAGYAASPSVKVSVSPGPSAYSETPAPTASFSTPSTLSAPPAGNAEETEAWFSVSQMAFANERIGWLAGENETGTFLGATSNGAADWTKVSTGGMYLTALAPLSREQGIVVGKSGCQEQSGILGCSSLGIYETSDGGVHWTARWEAKLDGGSPYAADVLSVSPKGWGYALTENRLLLTRDGGVTWQTAAFTDKAQDFVPEKAAFSGPWLGWAAGYILAPGCVPQGTEQAKAEAGCRIPAVAHTDNNGSNWQIDVLPEAERGETVIGVSAPDAQNGLVLLYNPDNFQASLYSNAMGENGGWGLVGEFRGGRPYAKDMHFLSAKRGFVALAPGAGPIEGGLMVTGDGGNVWETAPIDDIVGVTRISFTDERLGWLLGEANRERHTLLRTRDGGVSWEKVSLPAEIFSR